jgi:hypothetical protein
LDVTAKKAAWHSNRLPRFLKANLNVYRKRQHLLVEIYCSSVQISSFFLLGYGEALRADRGSRHGTNGLLSYLDHQHSKVLLDAVLPFKAEDGTGQYPNPFFMEPSAPHVQATIVIRRCPRQKRLGGLVHVPTRENALTKPCMLSTTKTFHPYIVGYPQVDDQLKEWDSHITPPTQ